MIVVGQIENNKNKGTITKEKEHPERMINVIGSELGTTKDPKTKSPKNFKVRTRCTREGEFERLKFVTVFGQISQQFVMV